MVYKMLEKVREKKPLVHAVTNYVTINDVANAIIASGASPIMTDQPLAITDVAKVSNGLALNLGTPLAPEDIERLARFAMRSYSHQLVVLDPVGITAVTYKEKLTHRLIDDGSVTLLKGNASEIRSLLKGTPTGQGVDSLPEDLVNERNLAQTIADMLVFAQRKNLILVLTGEVDIITDGDQVGLVRNGQPLMQQYTGAGCQLNGILAAFLAANQPADYFKAALGAVLAYTIAGDIAFERLQEGEGNATYRNRVIDSLFLLERDEIERRANYEIR